MPAERAAAATEEGSVEEDTEPAAAEGEGTTLSGEARFFAFAREADGRGGKVIVDEPEKMEEATEPRTRALRGEIGAGV